jgi:hypothetical protein
MDPTPTPLVLDYDQENAISQSLSCHSSFVSNSRQQGLDKVSELQSPLTPTKCIFDSCEDVFLITRIDITKVDKDNKQQAEAISTTPLLPPLIMDARASIQLPTQSPLQSPSVAKPSWPLSTFVRPMDTVIIPQLPELHSSTPSNKVSSLLHHTSINHTAPLTSSYKVFTMLAIDSNDEWTNKLGHANFTIYPEPCVPATFTPEACRQLLADWDLARQNYTKHLARTGEHYGVTSNIYKLTEQKWLMTDSIWQKVNDLAITNAKGHPSNTFVATKHAAIGHGGRSIVNTKIPCLSDPFSEGKFLPLGDEDIVGPMFQAAPQSQQTPGRKAKLWRLIVGKFSIGWSSVSLLSPTRILCRRRGR